MPLQHLWLVRGIQQLGIIGFGEALALVSAAFALAGAALAAVLHAVDQPRPLAGLDAQQGGQRDALVARAGDFHHRGGTAPSPGAALGRPYALAGLVFEAKPGAQVRRRPFITGQASSRQAAIAASSRSAARRAGTCTLHPIRCSSRSSPARV